MSKTGRGQEGEMRGLWQNLCTTTETATEAHPVRGRESTQEQRTGVPSRGYEEAVDFSPTVIFPYLLLQLFRRIQPVME